MILLLLLSSEVLVEMVLSPVVVMGCPFHHFLCLVHTLHLDTAFNTSLPLLVDSWRDLGVLNISEGRMVVSQKLNLSA